MDNKNVIKFQAEEHELINDDYFFSVEEYLLQLMHRADYGRAKLIVSNKTVLDIGCNCGYGTHLLSQSCDNIVGVDVSAAAISTAKAKYQHKNLSFTIVDGVTLPFESDTFDAITSFQVIEHLADYKSYFSEIRRVLKPDGILLLTTPNAAIRIKPDTKPWNRFHVHEFRSDELLSILGKYFPFVEVLGQFAAEHAYTVEYNRCLAAKGSMDCSPLFSLKRQVVNMLPGPLRNSLRSLLARLQGGKASEPLPEQIMAKYSTDDFFYRTSELDTSLSLVACCTFSDDALIRATQSFLMGEL